MTALLSILTGFPKKIKFGILNLMKQDEQIRQLIKKGLFDQRLKEQRQKKKIKRNLKIISLIALALIILSFSILAYQLIPISPTKISSKTEIETAEQPNSPKKKINIFESILPFDLSKEEKPTFNILALGRPGQGYPGQNLTDTIILVHLEPVQKKAILISLPRDLLVKVPGRNNLTKINSLYHLVGIERLKKKITEITGLPINYYILIDLVVAKEIITLVDGLNVYVPQDINDPYFPGPNYTYQTFNLSAGWRYLDGETALKYIRTRYTSPNGDFDRMTRQQQVINLLKQKVLTLNLLWDFPTYLKIFNTLRDHIETDLGLLELKNLWQIAKETQVDQITNLVIDKKETNLLTGGQIPFGQQMASVVYPKAGQGEYEEIKKYIQKYISNK
jgi:LCP family protein required for cell wall assembly